MFERILVANDGSDGALRAFDAAVRLAAAGSGRLHMISVEQDLPRYAEMILEVAEKKEEDDTYFGQLAAQAKRRAALGNVTVECTVLAGHDVKRIVEFARENHFDLLVIGFTGHSKIYEHLWGSTSQNLARLGCLTVLGIATGDHVVGLSGSQSVANAGFQLTESGMSTAGEILSESLL
ncbi:MAG: universal stress protein, partial [Acidobacteria bacterium]|nr:universal stress protein [Acidobacteriota bacterium]